MNRRSFGKAIASALVAANMILLPGRQDAPIEFAKSWTGAGGVMKLSFFKGYKLQGGMGRHNDGHMTVWGSDGVPRRI